MKTPIGVPVVTCRPASSSITPDRMRASSGSRRWVVKRDVPGPAAVEFGLDVGGLERDARRAAVDDAADSRAVALAEGRDAEEMAEAVVRHSAYIRGRASPRQTTAERKRPVSPRVLTVHRQFMSKGAVRFVQTTPGRTARIGERQDVEDNCRHRAQRRPRPLASRRSRPDRHHCARRRRRAGRRDRRRDDGASKPMKKSHHTAHKKHMAKSKKTHGGAGRRSAARRSRRSSEELIRPARFD